ncbi:MAG: hypothetical protein E7459_00895 [Ruminococcaceae bacterium]|nr:hypothetical protein [Oscillospiraceae bacterium]
MKRTRLHKLLSAIMALVMVLTCLVPAAGAVSPEESVTVSSAGEMITPSAELNRGEAVTIMVELSGDTTYVQTGDLQMAAAATDSHFATLARAESQIEATLSQNVEVEERYSLLFNGFSFTGERWMIDAINKMDGVRAFEAPMFELVTPTDETEMDLTPSMSKSTNLTGAIETWDLGYSGEGMAVAIIDTGIRQTHEAFAVAPANPKVDLAYLLDVYNEYGEYLHAGTVKDLNDIYYSEKLPFNWDYYDGDAIPNHTSSDHGSHVAGIAAGNNGANFKGVAPEAQIFVMQVFNTSGGASFATVLAALEDCVYLGVDSINMSLGLCAAHDKYDSVGIDMAPAYKALEEAGISVIAAAGNDYNAYRSESTFGTLYWGAQNPDSGLVGAPAIFEGSMAVASITNADKNSGYHMVAYGDEYVPVASTRKTTPAFNTLGYGEYDLVYAGGGSAEEMAAANVAGKIVLTVRDSNTFASKAQNAVANGAIGILIYNNVAGTVKTSAASTIPVATLTQDEGLRLVGKLTNGEGKITIKAGTPYAALTMADSSSWGTTPELAIKPEITAPGGTVNSVNGSSSDTAYKNNSGTSMAAPHVAGGVLLVKQHLREVYPEATDAEIYKLAYSYLMSTAHPINTFVRRQGAGVMNVAAAVRTQAYLSVPGSARPKLELQDSVDGTFTFTFEIHNDGDTAKEYSIIGSAVTEGTTVYSHNNGTPAYRTDGSVKDITNMVNFNGPETVAVAANSTVKVTMTIAASEELLEMYAEQFTSGMYLEGHIKLLDQDADGVDLAIPYLGFVGNWNYPSMIDDGYYWQTATGEYNPAQSSITKGTYIGSGIRDQGLGLNPYADMKGQTYHADRNAISPNNDGFMDSVDYVEFTLLRNPRSVKLYLQDAEGNVLATYQDASYSFRKEYNVSGWNGGLGYSSMAFLFDGAEIDENETAYIVLEAWLDRESFDITENKNGRLVFPVTKDLTAPVVTAVDGGVEILDTNYIAYYAVYADESRTRKLFETGVFAMERGQKETYTTDLTTYYVAVADYAQNEAFYMVENGVVTKLDKDGFGHTTKTAVGRMFVNYNTGEESYAFVEYNPETHLYLKPVTEVTSEKNIYNNYYGYSGPGEDFRTAAINVDGTVYITSKDHLLTLDPETYAFTEVAKYWVDGDYIYNSQCLVADPETYEFYAYAWTNALGGWNYTVCNVNIETGEITPLWKLPKKFGTVSTSSGVIGMTFVDTGVLAFAFTSGYVCLVNAADGSTIEVIDLRDYFGSGINYIGLQGSGGTVLYDKDSNTLYIYSAWQWFRDNHYDLPGMISVDLTNRTAKMHATGIGDGVFMHGLYFKEDAKPADFYYAMQLIDAIGEVDVASGEAIEAAREAYEAVREDRKVRVENYETLLKAELAYYGLMAEQCAADARQSAAEARAAMAAAEASAKEAMNTTATDTTAANKAQTAAEEARIAAEEAANAAEETAAKVSLMEEALRNAAMATEQETIEAELKTAADTLPAALTAAAEARTAADTAIGAQAKAGHQAQAQVARNLSESAEAYATEAGNRAEEIYALAVDALNTTAQDKSAAYEAVALAEEVLAAAEVAQTAANDAAEAAMEAADAADNLDTATLEEAVKNAQNGEEVAEIYRDIVEILAQQVLDLIDAQKAQENEEAAALTAARVEAMEKIAALVGETGGFSAHQVADWETALDTALEAVEAAGTIEEIEAILEELNATLETIAASCPANDFTDVTENAWYHDAVDYVVLRGMMKGKGNGEFAPAANLTRAELVTVLYRMTGEPSVDGLVNPFADVPAGTWYTDAVVWAYHTGVVNGMSEDTFAPNANITREQIATILYRYAGAEEAPEDALTGYTDAGAISPWAVEAMRWAVSADIINGMTINALAPQGNATRGQIATILMRYCEN